MLNLEIGTTLILKEYSNNLKQRKITREKNKKEFQNVDNEMIHLDIYICVCKCVCISMNDYYD